MSVVKPLSPGSTAGLNPATGFLTPVTAILPPTVKADSGALTIGNVVPISDKPVRTLGFLQIGPGSLRVMDQVSEAAPKPRAYVFLDLETTGLSILKHGIIQIGAYITGEDEDDLVEYYVSDTNPIIPAYSTGLRSSPTVEIDQSALDVNKFTRERIADARALPTVLKEFHGVLTRIARDKEIVLVMHGAKFDTPRIEVAYERIGVEFPWSRRVLCTVSIGFTALGKRIGSLAVLAKELGIHNRMAHDGLADAITTSKVFHALVRRMQHRG